MGRRAGVAACVLAAVLVLDAGVGFASEAGSTFISTPVPLELSVNGAHGPISFVLSRSDDVLVPVADLVQTGVTLADSTPQIVIGATSYVSLRALAPAITYSVDDTSLMLELQVPVALLAGTHLALQAPARALAHAVTSGFLNYDLTANVANGAPGNSGAFAQFGVGGDRGVLSTSLNESSLGLTRGLTSFVHENQLDLTRGTLGDLTAQGDVLGSTIVLGGAGIARAFDVQPDFLHFPTAGINGTVLTPSTADVYVNGAFVKTVQLQPGAFSISDLQLQTGADDTTVVLHDANGGTTTLNASSYVGADLLRKGLTDYEYDVGFTRPDPFGLDDRYGPLSALGRYRVGISNGVTVGGRFEAQSSLVSFGPRIDLGSPIGTFAFYDAYSNDRGTIGHAAAAAYVYAGRAVTLDLSATKYSASYANLQLAPGDDRRLSEVDASMALPLARRAALTIETSTVVDRDFGTSQIWSSDLRVALSPRANLDLTANRASAPRGTWALGTSLMFHVGARTDVTLSTQSADHLGDTGLLVDEPAPQNVGFGYHLEHDDGTDGSYTNAYAIDRTNDGDVSLTLSNGAGTSTGTLAVRGGIAVFPQGIVASRPLVGSYALADVAGLSHAPIDLNGVPAGTTDGRGLLVLPGLAPYVKNTVAVGDLDAFSDLDPTVESADVIPRNNAAVLAPLVVQRIRIFRGTVVIARGGSRVIPAFGRLTLTRRAQTFQSDLGTDGAFYFENLAPGSYAATIESDAGGCTFAFAVPHSDRMVMDLGPRSCTP